MTTSITPSAHLTHIHELLNDTYGEPHNRPDHNPLGGLIGTILSQHTSDKNSGRAYEQLITRYPRWEDVRDAPTYEIADTIRSGGLANVKAPRIQEALHTLTERQQAQGDTKALTDYLYTELTRSNTEDAWKYLRSIPGVGPKTAACVLMFNLGQPTMPIDTHVHRVSQRLGLIGPKVTADKAHEIFLQIAPAAWIYALHVNMIRHGRKICHAQRPDCDHCPLFQVCAYVGHGTPHIIPLSQATDE